MMGTLGIHYGGRNDDFGSHPRWVHKSAFLSSTPNCLRLRLGPCRQVATQLLLLGTYAWSSVGLIPHHDIRANSDGPTTGTNPTQREVRVLKGTIFCHQPISTTTTTSPTRHHQPQRTTSRCQLSLGRYATTVDHRYALSLPPST